MKRTIAGLALVVVTAALSGCYYYPDYSYVRPVTTTAGGDAYYGSGVTYANSYYAYPGYYYPYGYYGYGYGCCYGPAVSIGIGGVWYGGSRYYGGRYYGGHYYGRGPSGGHGGWGGRGGWSGHGNTGH
ncbi:hypothetical protein [Dyella sp. C9]|uniref:hypothetical protein n=1 Tax=Dyella sp. C9 TaxID=2202154 RepID=UPI000DEED847|nr:hypothetical protein [Dyella sp. C9]